MIVQSKFFALNLEHSAQEWGSIVATLARGTKTGERVIQQTYLDTFDWSLYRAGLTLAFEEGEESNLKIITDSQGADFPLTVPCLAQPQFPQDLPEGKTAKQIAKLMGLRALLPLAQVRSEQICIEIRNKSDQLRVPLYVECNFHIPGPRRRSIELGCRLRIDCIKGQEKAFNKAVSRFDRQMLTTQFSFFDQLMQSQDLVPLGYSSKLDIQLDRAQRSDEALKAILLNQLDQIEATVDGTLNATDTEFLHDLRVAVRRSRSALGRIKGALPQTVENRFARELAWIGSITTPLRDLDVYLLAYPEYRDSLSTEQRENLQPLYDFLLHQQTACHNQLCQDLRSARFLNFMEKWRQFLERPVPQRPTALNASCEIGDLADRRIWKTYRRVISEGSSITGDSPAEALHDLRKTCKKLRYLLEFFASLYDKDKVAQLVKRLKGLQENLGDFQDLDVQAEKLHDYSRQMMEGGENRPQVFMSMGVLIEGFMERKASVREEFTQRFDSFASKEVEKQFRLLCSKNKPAKVALNAHLD